MRSYLTFRLIKVLVIVNSLYGLGNSLTLMAREYTAVTFDTLQGQYLVVHFYVLTFHSQQQECIFLQDISSFILSLRIFYQMDLKS